MFFMCLGVVGLMWSDFSSSKWSNNSWWCL